MIRRITDITLIAIVVTSSFGAIVQRHYCQNELKSSALWFKPKSCHEVDMGKSCPMHSAMAMDKSAEDRCCDTRTTYVKNETDQVHIMAPVLKNLLFERVLWTIGFTEQIIDQQIVQPEYLNYRPPLILCDPSSELQTFLC